MSTIIPSFRIFNKQMKSINYSLLNQADMIDLPLTFSLCQFNIQPFEILIRTVSKGNEKKKIDVFFIK
jgi:hypothetical protein